MKTPVRKKNTTVLKPTDTGHVPGTAVPKLWQHIRYRRFACATLILAAACCVLLPGYARAEARQYGVSIAVLPFEVFSSEMDVSLGSEAARLLAKQLAINPAIVCVDNDTIRTTLQPAEYGSLTEARLHQAAKLLNANCIITGTVTKIRNEHSIDVQVFSTAAQGPSFKTYAEGLELQDIVETLAAAIDQELLEKADQIPVAQRPRVSAKPQPLPQTDSRGFSVERELLATFGPQPDESRVPDTPVPVAADEAFHDDSDHAAVQNTEPSTEVTAEPAGASRKQRSAGGTETPFFSFTQAININADSMEYDNRANKASFRGNVVARQDDIVMFAGNMDVYYSEEGDLSRVEAHGNVRIMQGDRIATGDAIVFNSTDQTIVATGNPRVWQGDNVVHGQKITVFLNEDRTVVEGDSDSRASATIQPDGAKETP